MTRHFALLVNPAAAGGRAREVLPVVRGELDRLDARYRVIETTDRFWTVLAAADLGVSRAGGTVWELAAAGLPALLVPYPHATGDHQHANAEYFAAAGGAVIVEDAALDGEQLRNRVAELRAAPGRLDDMRNGMLRRARPDAAAVVARELLRLARDRA